MAGLLARLLPAIYADPNRPRTCPECGREFQPGAGVRTSWSRDACSVPCQQEYDDKMAL